MPEARPKIEREKIRKRRPNDLLFDEGEAPVARQPHLIDDVDQGDHGDAPQFQDDTPREGTEEDWTVERGSSEEAIAWDHEPEEDWVLEGDDGGHREDAVESFEGDEEALGDFEEESGVVWEDDGLPNEYVDDSPDELSFGSESESFGTAPEVELAGRRDVRPKAPRPAPPPGTSAPAQPQRQQPPPQERTRERQPRPDRDASGEALAPRSGFRKPELESRAPPNGPAQSDSKRFSRTRATLGVPAGVVVGASDEEVLEQPRSGPTQRRRQAQPAPALPRAGRRNIVRHGKRGGKGLIMAGLLMLLAGSGWFAYQSIGPDGFGSMLDRVSALIPLSGSSRTAADTSFGGREASEPGSVSAEKALSDLEQRIRQQDAREEASPAAGVDGPPIPKFKPSPGSTRSLSTATPGDATDEAQLAANEGAGADDEQVNGLSIFQQLWRYLSPG